MSDQLFAIIVTVKVEPGRGKDLIPYMINNATCAVRDELGCHQFQVLVDEDEPDTFVYYEVYDNAEALETHRQQPHFLEFGKAAEGLIVDRHVRRLNLIKGL